jgi:hypothetical protein
MTLRKGFKKLNLEREQIKMLAIRDYHVEETAL